MAYLNKVMLIGNLTRDPELRYLPDGTPVCDFGVAVNRRYRSTGGEQKEEVLFIDVTAWRKQAEVVSEFLQKGRPILIEGRLKMDQWTQQDGQKRNKINVVLERFEFMDARPSGGGGAQGERRAPAPAKPQPTPPPQQQQKPPQGTAPPAQSDFDQGEDSIPF